MPGMQFPCYLLVLVLWVYLMVHKSPQTKVCNGLPTALTEWKNDVTIDYSFDSQIDGKNTERKAITYLSKDSLMRLAFVAHNTPVTFDCMVTLTYPGEFDSDGRKVKRHLQRWLQWAQREQGIDAYLWALEFQRRHAPHFHVFTRSGSLLAAKKGVSKRWFEIVESGDDRHLKAGTKTEKLRSPDAAGRYAAKYASKPYQKAVPPNYRDVGRFWGHSRNVIPQPTDKWYLDGWGDLIMEFEGWEYRQRLLDRKPTKTLFNGTKFLKEKYDGTENKDVCLQP